MRVGGRIRMLSRKALFQVTDNPRSHAHQGSNPHMSVNAANDVAGQDPAVNPANPQNVGVQAHEGIDSQQLISSTSY